MFATRAQGALEEFQMSALKQHQEIEEKHSEV